MAMVSEESASELFQAQVHIWSQAFSFINFALLKSALELGIPDIIQKHGQPMTLSQLVTALPINPTKAHGIYRLMRVLVHSGYFAQESVTGRNEQEVFQYTITANSRLLLKDNPFSMSTHLLAILTPVPTEPWHFVSTWFQNDDPTPFITANGGRTFWDYARHESSLNISYNEIMASDSRLVASVVIHECKGVFFEGLNSLIDVGGGTGTLAKAISSAFPQLKCTVLDLPHVVANLQGSENLYFIEGNMFEAIPPADAVFLKWMVISGNRRWVVAAIGGRGNDG